jgi:hypothetical protein
MKNPLNQNDFIFIILAVFYIKIQIFWFVIADVVFLDFLLNFYNSLSPIFENSFLLNILKLSGITST